MRLSYGEGFSDPIPSDLTLWSSVGVVNKGAVDAVVLRIAGSSHRRSIVGSRHPRARGAQHVAAFTHCSSPVLCESPQSAYRHLWVNLHRAVRIGWPMCTTLRVERVHGQIGRAH